MTAGILFFVIKKTIGRRAAADEEHMGLDVLEHGTRGYNDFVLETDDQKVPAGVFINDT